MTATDKKRRKMAMAIGESFAAIRRRTARSLAWRSLGAPALKLYVELRLRWRHKDGNNGQLFCSLLECKELLGLCRDSAVRGFAELEAKRFIVRTRKGEAGRLPASGTAANGGTGFSRRATLWALTDEPFNGHAATYAFEKLSAEDLKRIDKELNLRRRMGTARQTQKQVHVSGNQTHKGPAIRPIKPVMGPAIRPVEADSGHFRGPANRPSISTISRSPSNCPPAGDSNASAEGSPKRSRRAPGWLVGGSPSVFERPKGAPTNGAPSTSPKRRKTHERIANPANAEKRKGWNSGSAWPAKERIALGLKQTEFAALAGIRREYLSAIEQGRRQPGPDIRARIAAALSERQSP
jgi:DNA-binding XRE family transcriptional regulator